MKNATGVVAGNRLKVEFCNIEVSDGLHVSGIEARPEYERKQSSHEASDARCPKNSPIHDLEWYINELKSPLAGCK
jgi:hypothetical protein